jgi:hypothetical protein
MGAYREGTRGASSATGYSRVGRQERSSCLVLRDKTGKTRKSAILGDHRKIEEGEQEAAIAAFLIAHEGHTQDVEVQRGAWTIYCRCRRCDDVSTYEVDNEARERALGLPPWPEDMQKGGKDNAC